VVPVSVSRVVEQCLHQYVRSVQLYEGKYWQERRCRIERVEQ
jgi:hypothetical protein